MNRQHPARVECVAAGTLIHTDRGLTPAARLARMRTPPLVASYNHFRVQFEYHKLLAVRIVRVHHLREITTEGGRSLWCTLDHPIYVIGRGYTPAHTIRPGSEVVAADDPPTPLHTRQFQLPWVAALRRSETARPHMPPPVRPGQPAPDTTPLPLRRRDWVRSNRVVHADNVFTAYDFQVEHCPNFLADGILVHNCLLLGNRITW